MMPYAYFPHRLSARSEWVISSSLGVVNTGSGCGVGAGAGVRAASAPVEGP